MRDLLTNLKMMSWGACKRDILPGVMMSNKTVLITGANSGIGLATTRDLVERGAKVIMACRNEEAAKKCANDIKSAFSNSDLIIRKVDMTSFASIKSLVDTMVAEGDISSSKGLDVLINNAGMVAGTERGPDTEDGYETTLQVNYLSPMLLTLLLLPYLKTKRQGSVEEPSRVINVSSIAHYSASTIKDVSENFNFTSSYNQITAYGQSKLYMILFTRHLSRLLREKESADTEHKRRRVVVHALHPGVMLNPILNEAKGTLMWLARNSSRFSAVTPEVGAQCSIYLAASPETKVTDSEASGGYWYDCQPAPSSSQARDPELAANLWTHSLKCINLPADFDV